MRSATLSTSTRRCAPTFQSTRSLRSATVEAFERRVHADISIHALLAERDIRNGQHWHPRSRFQSTRSLRSATKLGDVKVGFHCHFNPRAPCGARPAPDDLVFTDTRISIHALLAERDRAEGRKSGRHEHFNPRAPCGARPQTSGKRAASRRFQSTRSLRSATDVIGKARNLISNFNPRAPCGARPTFVPKYPSPFLISIHALLAERDSTPPYCRIVRSIISIHALLAERDQTFLAN